MMHIKLVAYRSHRRAAVWLYDLFPGVLVLGFGGWLFFALVRDGQWRGLFLLALAFAVATCSTLRLRIDREQPLLVKATRYWFLLPVKRRTESIDALASDHSDEWTAKSKDSHDDLAIGAWSIDCRNAEHVVAWLRESSVELATPQASVKG